MQRKVCPICRLHPVALNYYRKNKAYFRTACTGCIHKKRKPLPDVASWVRAGYKKSDRCDRCGFKFKLPEQSNVYYVDGNLANGNWLNLKTICLNCQQEITKTRWKPSDLRPDF